ncbi:MAG TPA: recombinase family protein [Ktedonobacterales bacterium]|nr:recombinase family protein [Ktedonobacterales bacterium]
MTREKAASLGWEVSEPHVYREVMGGEDLYRPQMDKLWDAILRHEIDALVVDVLDRLSRDEGDVGAVYHHADRYGVHIELASEDLDETEHGRNLRTLSGIMGRMERADIRRRTQRGRRARAAAGKLLPSSFPLYGYLWGDPEKGHRTYYVVDPETGWVVVLIFERIAAGVPIRRLCRQLEAEGIPTPAQVLERRGQLPVGRMAYGVWYLGTIQRIVHHPAYWGAHAAYRWEHSTGKVRPAATGITRKVHTMRVRAESDPVRVALPVTTCPALVSADLAARVATQLAVNKAECVGRPVADPLATLWRGMAVCGHCGARLITAPSSHRETGRRYTCRHRDHTDPMTGARHPCPGGGFSMNADALDPQGWADVLAWLSDPENVERLLSEWQQQTTRAERTHASRLAAVDATLATLREKMAELGADIDATTQRESRRVLLAHLDAHAAQVEREEAKRVEVLREAETRAQQATAAQSVRDAVQMAAARAAGADRARQRVILRALGARLTLWRADYVHPDGWPQRYKVRLHWTGWTGQEDAPITLPPSSQLTLTTSTSCPRSTLPAARSGASKSRPPRS